MPVTGSSPSELLHHHPRRGEPPVGCPPRSLRPCECHGVVSHPPFWAKNPPPSTQPTECRQKRITLSPPMQLPSPRNVHVHQHPCKASTPAVTSGALPPVTAAVSVHSTLHCTTVSPMLWLLRWRSPDVSRVRTGNRSVVNHPEYRLLAIDHRHHQPLSVACQPPSAAGQPPSVNRQPQARKVTDSHQLTAGAVKNRENGGNCEKRCKTVFHKVLMPSQRVACSRQHHGHHCHRNSAFTVHSQHT